MEKVKAYPTIDNIGRNNYELIGKDIEPKSKCIRSSHSQITALNKSMPPRNKNEISYNYAKENCKKDLENTSCRVSQKGSSKRYHLRSPSEIKKARSGMNTSKSPVNQKNPKTPIHPSNLYNPVSILSTKKSTFPLRYQNNLNLQYGRLSTPQYNESQGNNDNLSTSKFELGLNYKQFEGKNLEQNQFFKQEIGSRHRTSKREISMESTSSPSESSMDKTNFNALWKKKTKEKVLDEESAAGCKRRKTKRKSTKTIKTKSKSHKRKHEKVNNLATLVDVVSKCEERMHAIDKSVRYN